MMEEDIFYEDIDESPSNFENEPDSLDLLFFFLMQQWL